jgi:hypothetical protein
MPRIGAGTGELPVSATRQITTGDGLQGGGSLATDLDLEVRFGTDTDTVARGNDSRLSDSRPWTLYGGGSPTAGQSLVFDTGTGKFVPGATVGVDAEAVRDIIGATLVAGTNASITVNDAGDTVTIGATGGGGSTSDATTSAKGIIQLAGDLGGTAAAPTVPNVEKTTRKSTATAKIADGYIGADTNGNIFRSHLPGATTSLQGSIQLAGDLGGTSTAPTVPGLANKVDNTQRFPLGGHVQITYAATVAPNATLGNSFYISATGGVTINPPTGGVDGQRIVIEVYASGVARSVSVASSIAAMTGVLTTASIPASKIGLVALFYSARTAAWTLTALNTAV